MEQFDKMKRRGKASATPQLVPTWAMVSPVKAKKRRMSEGAAMIGGTDLSLLDTTAEGTQGGMREETEEDGRKMIHPRTKLSPMGRKTPQLKRKYNKRGHSSLSMHHTL